VENIGGFQVSRGRKADFDALCKNLQSQLIRAKCTGHPRGAQGSRFFLCGLLICEERWLKLIYTEAANALIRGIIMQWTAPAFEEVCLNCEINSYASAKL
jgi:coenzyme PQQ precursor peptide PqqA